MKAEIIKNTVHLLMVFVAMWKLSLLKGQIILMEILHRV